MYKRKLDDSKEGHPKRLKSLDRDSITDTEDIVPIKVFCRIRPVSSQPSDIYEITSSHSLKINPPSHASETAIEQFEFTSILGPCTTQEQVAATICYPLINDFVEKGKSALLFSYGITNAGKTHTIMGTYENPGITIRALKDLIDRNLTFKVQFFEIYNDRVYDLLQEYSKKEQRQSLKVRQDSSNVKIIGISEKRIQTFTEAMDCLRLGLNNRKLAETACNQVSSRSHSVFLIMLEGENAPKFAIVDLAGAERTLRANTVGERLKEASYINNSLSVLGRCLEAIKNNQSKGKKDMIPFRDTLLTKIFSEFFGMGEDKNISLIININQCKEDFEETLSVLKFGAITTGIKPMKSKLGQHRNVPGQEIARLQELEELLRAKEEEIEELKRQEMLKTQEQLQNVKQRELELESELRSKIAQEVESMLAKQSDLYKTSRDMLIKNYDEIMKTKDEMWASKLSKLKKNINCIDTCTSPLRETIVEVTIPKIYLNPFVTEEISIQTEDAPQPIEEKFGLIKEIKENTQKIKEEDTENKENQQAPKPLKSKPKHKTNLSSPIARRTRKGLRKNAH
ncbi:unnamed protein product [Blepharisma stoltei]|uniref:Kinesin motor domain-containing protein n=1 Tax=Blepharisma stoltei TaxID=1481888 RepID=A0AAU9JT90_9CILI|nr:unnamed protein product [Blepharisma stoltei]